MQREDSFIPENDLKIVILGQGAVGKSSISSQFVNKEFHEEYNPTLQEVLRKTMVIDDRPVTLGNKISFVDLTFSLMRLRHPNLNRNT